MTAREELEHYLTFSGHGPQKRKALIDAFAHELAERIRHHDFDANLVGTRCGCSEGLTDDAADLIDPHANAGPVRPDEEPSG